MQTNILSTTQLSLDVLDILPEFLRKCGKIPSTPTSMLPSEILAFCAACRAAGIEKVVESGRSYGYSTRCLVKMGFNVISYDHRPIPHVDANLSQYRNLKLEIGPCPIVVTTKPQFGLLLDGPKGNEALELADKSNPTVVAIHDCHVKAPIRTVIEQRRWVTTDLLEPCNELDLEHLLSRNIHDRSVLKEAFVLGIARFI